MFALYTYTQSRINIMKNIHISFVTFPLGELIIGTYDNKLCICDWRYRKMRSTIDNRLKNLLDTQFEEKEDEIIKQTVLQLEEYMSGERREFNIPLLLIGTDFQKSVWRELLKIEYGQTSTYLQQSIKLNNKDAIRAVASANGANAISIIVPCHRIVGSNGELVGYAGGLAVKEKLLKLEGAKLIQQENQGSLF